MSDDLKKLCEEYTTMYIIGNNNADIKRLAKACLVLLEALDDMGWTDDDRFIKEEVLNKVNAIARGEE